MVMRLSYSNFKQPHLDSDSPMIPISIFLLSISIYFSLFLTDSLIDPPEKNAKDIDSEAFQATWGSSVRQFHRSEYTTSDATNTIHFSWRDG